MKKLEIKVDNCLECPFVNNDNEFGADNCNLNTDIYSKKHQELPNNKRHEKCPLNNSNYEIIGI